VTDHELSSLYLPPRSSHWARNDPSLGDSERLSKVVTVFLISRRSLESLALDYKFSRIFLRATNLQVRQLQVCCKSYLFDIINISFGILESTKMVPFRAYSKYQDQPLWLPLSKKINEFMNMVVEKNEFECISYCSTARSQGVETGNGYRNANQSLEWSVLVSFSKSEAHLERDLKISRWRIQEGIHKNESVSFDVFESVPLENSKVKYFVPQNHQFLVPASKMEKSPDLLL